MLTVNKTGLPEQLCTEREREREKERETGSLQWMQGCMSPCEEGVCSLGYAVSLGNYGE